MTKQIPKFHETFIPILKALEQRDEIHSEELKRKVRDVAYADLPSELLTQKISSGGLKIINRIGWGISYLKQGKFVEQPRRAYVKITPKGLTALKSGKLTLTDLKKDSDYLQAQESKDKEKSVKPIEVTEKDYSPQDLIEDGFLNFFSISFSSFNSSSLKCATVFNFLSISLRFNLSHLCK